MQSNFFIHAINIHSGGGKSLLEALFLALPKHLGVFLQLDERMPKDKIRIEDINLRLIHPSIFNRLAAEWWLHKNVKINDVTLCFGNLPPLFHLSGRVIIFLQNRYLIDPVSLKHFDLKTRLRLLIERLWFRLKSKNADIVIVQTPSMLALLNQCSYLKSTKKALLPFVADASGYQKIPIKNVSATLGQKFLYVASGDPHKNHIKLIEAWHLLAQEGIRPTLWLTIDANNYKELCSWIQNESLMHGLSIKNMQMLSHPAVLELYNQVDAVIFPSTFESFGIPLIEAKQASLPILASELDYVRDLIDPDQVFDPHSAVSIARAVKRFLKFDEAPLPLLNADDFIEQILNIGQQ